MCVPPPLYDLAIVLWILAAQILWKTALLRCLSGIRPFQRRFPQMSCFSLRSINEKAMRKGVGYPSVKYLSGAGYYRTVYWPSFNL